MQALNDLPRDKLVPPENNCRTWTDVQADLAHMNTEVTKLVILEWIMYLQLVTGKHWPVLIFVYPACAWMTPVILLLAIVIEWIPFSSKMDQLLDKRKEVLREFHALPSWSHLHGLTWSDVLACGGSWVLVIIGMANLACMLLLHLRRQ